MNETEIPHLEEFNIDTLNKEIASDTIEEDKYNFYFLTKIVSVYKKLPKLKKILGNDIEFFMETGCSENLLGEVRYTNRGIAIWKKADKDKIIQIYFEVTKTNIDTAIDEVIAYMDEIIKNGKKSKSYNISTGAFRFVPARGLKFAIEDFSGIRFNDESFEKIMRVAYKHKTAQSQKYEKIIKRQKKKEKKMVQKYNELLKKQKRKSSTLILISLFSFLITIITLSIYVFDGASHNKTKKEFEPFKEMDFQQRISKRVKNIGVHNYEILKKEKEMNFKNEQKN